jgi:dinuclear metal center YbgI/SA1388 family protein
VRPVPVVEIAAYLDQYLRIGEVPDEPGAVNGLQVENGSGAVTRLVAAVDASQATIDAVVALDEPALLLVHHGLFWDGNLPVTGRRFRRLGSLLKADIAVYSAHIPLDVHPEVGNNVVLAKAIGLGQLAPFDSYKGIDMGVRGVFADGLSRGALVERLDGLLRTRSRLVGGGPEEIRSVGVITGGAGSRIGAASAAGLDAFVTGEGAHHTYFDAMEFKVNTIYAGHYATEQVGVKALAVHLGDRFGIPWDFHDHPTGM